MEINISKHIISLVATANTKHILPHFCYHRKTSVNAYKLIGNFPLTLILKFKKNETESN